jgi:hypothetical protein
VEQRHRIIRHPGLDPLWATIARDHRHKQLAALTLLLGGLAVALFTLHDFALWPFAGSLASTAGLFWLFRLLSEQPVAAWREELRERPEQFVWVYGMVTERMPFGLNLMRGGLLYLMTERGEMHDFALPADKLLLVSKTLNRLLPRAEFGYTPERELKYRGEITQHKRTLNE